MINKITATHVSFVLDGNSYPQIGQTVSLESISIAQDGHSFFDGISLL